MLSNDPIKMMEEVTAAREDTRKRTMSMRDIKASYMTPFFRAGSDNMSAEMYSPENHAYKFTSWMVPQLAYSNPRMRIGSRDIGGGDQALLMKYYADQWAIDVTLDEFLVAPATDILFGCCSTIVTLEDHPYLKLDDGAAAKMPVMRRISPEMLFVDQQAYTRRETRFIGHDWDIDKEDLVRMAEEDKGGGWNVKLAKEVAISEAMGEQGRATMDRVDRKQITLHDIWVPERRKIITLVAGIGGDQNVADYVREIDYDGPAWGPYQIGDVYYVGDEPMGLAPLVAVHGQTMDLNRHARATAKSAAQYKRLILVDNSDPEFVAQIQSGEHDLVISVPGLEKHQIVNVEIGGITQEILAYLELSRSRLERESGMSATQQGDIRTGATATEASIAETSSDVRSDWVKLQFHRFVRQGIRTVCWYAYEKEAVRQVLPLEAATELELPETDGVIVYKGGRREGDPPFEAFSFEIEPMSMERTTQGVAASQAMQMFDIVTQVLQLSPTNPHGDWGGLLEAMGDALNIPGMGDFYDEEMAAEVGAQQMELQAAGASTAQPQGGGGGGSKLHKALFNRIQPSATSPTKRMFSGKSSGSLLGAAQKK